MPGPLDLTPKQLEILEHLLDRGGVRPMFDGALASELAAALETGLGDVVPSLPEVGRMVVGKFHLQQIFTCEGKYAASVDSFEWTLQNVRGRIAHRAVERLVVAGDDSSPMDLAEGALSYLAEEEEARGPGAFLRGIDEEERHALVLAVSDIVTKFVIDWPPIERAWIPRIESTSKFPLFGGRLELNTRVDLALGMPRGLEARTFVVDLKTGRPSPDHRQDLRFYALVETLARGTPPFRVASYYLDSGTYDYEDITADALWETVAVVVPGIIAMCRVRADGPSTLHANPLCPWCPAFDHCDVGQEEFSR
ncbi:MAG TPA: PD-(D/E)XK nuclease family protein [Acidimicrobiales bacterium]|jgi:hypothetical protein